MSFGNTKTQSVISELEWQQVDLSGEPPCDPDLFGDDEMGFGGKRKRGIGAFLSNASKVAGRQIGRVEKTIQKANGDVSRKLGKIPLVGTPLKTVYGVVYNASTAPMRMTVDVAVHHKRIDRVALGHLKETVRDVKSVAGYAQTVVTLIPGVGTGVGAALGAGLALANGQPIDKVLIAGVSGALPGGPLASAALTMAVSGVKAAATGQKVDLKFLANTAVSGAGAGLGLPPAATQAINAGVSLAGNLASGQKLDKALTSAAVEALPLDPKVKAAVNEAAALSLDLAHGKRVDKALVARIEGVAKLLPVGDLHAEVVAIAKGGQKLAEGKKLGEALATSLHAGVAGSLIAAGGKTLPKEAMNALQSGIAMGAGAVHQVQTSNALAQSVGKIGQAGLELSKSVPVFAEARKLAKNGTKGFDLGAGITASVTGVFELQAVRSKLSPDDKRGFDMALATRVGTVTRPPATKLSAAAQAGAALTFGLQGNEPKNNASVLALINASPSASVGAKAALVTVAKERESLLRRIGRALGLMKG